MVSLNHLQGENVKAVLEDSLYARPLQVNYFLKNINRLVFIKFADCAVCEVGTEFLCAIRRTSVFKCNECLAL